MKKAIAAFLGLALWSTASHAGDFWMFAAGQRWESDGTLTASVAVVDLATLVYGQTERKAWDYLIRIDHDKIVEVTGVRHSYKCSEGESAIIQYADLDSDTFAVTNSKTIAAPSYESAIPETLLARVHDFICIQRANTPPDPTSVKPVNHVTGSDLKAVKNEVWLWAAMSAAAAGIKTPKAD